MALAGDVLEKRTPVGEIHNSQADHTRLSLIGEQYHVSKDHTGWYVREGQGL